MTATLNLAAALHILQSIWRHPANRHRRIRATSTFLLWQLAKRIFGRRITIGFHGAKLACYPDSTSTSSVLYYSGYPDYWEMKFLQAYLRLGDNFLDIGANTGVYSILAASCVGLQGSIDAFEPVERTALRIEEQAALNGLQRLRVHRLAVSDRNGEVDFGYSGNDAMMHLRRPGEPGQAGRQAKTVTLDSFEHYKEYAAGKMDIEGAEPFALAGAAERLRQANPPVWLLELAGYATCYGVSSEEIVLRLSRQGFDCAVFDPASGTLCYTGTPWELGVQNVLAVSREHRALVEERLASRRARPS